MRRGSRLSRAPQGDICSDEPRNHVKQATTLFWRENLPLSNRLRLTGSVERYGRAVAPISSLGRFSIYVLTLSLSSTDCSLLSNAEVDVWQADSEGVYGAINGDKGYCRGVVKSDQKGQYAVATQQPGAYGSTRVFFGTSLVPDLPPYGPRHLHVVVWHPQHRLGVFQIYFANDPAREWDWRAALAHNATLLGSTEPSLKVSPDSSGNVHFDFVLEPLSASETPFASRYDALVARCASEEVPVPALCNPGVARWLRAEVLLLAVLVLLYVSYWVTRLLCCRPPARAAPKRKHD